MNKSRTNQPTTYLMNGLLILSVGFGGYFLAKMNQDEPRMAPSVQTTPVSAPAHLVNRDRDQKIYKLGICVGQTLAQLGTPTFLPAQIHEAKESCLSLMKKQNQPIQLAMKTVPQTKLNAGNPVAVTPNSTQALPNQNHDTVVKLASGETATSDISYIAP